MIDTSDQLRYGYMALYSVARLLPGLTWSLPVIYLYPLVLIIVMITSVLYMGRRADWTYFVELIRDHLLLHAFTTLVVDPLRIGLMRRLQRFIDEFEAVQPDSDCGGNELFERNELSCSHRASISSPENLSQHESKALGGWKEAKAYHATTEATILQRLMKKREAGLKGLHAAERALTRAMQDAMETASKVLELQDDVDRLEHLIGNQKVPKALLKQWMAEKRQLRRKVAIGISTLSLCSEDIADLCNKLGSHQSAVSLLDAEIVAAQHSSQ